MTKPAFYSLLNPHDIVSIFSSSELYEKKSFHFLEKNTKTYDVARNKDSYIQESQLLYEKFYSGHTLIVNNLENFNLKIKQKCSALEGEVNVHMYLVPQNGNSSFDFHQDDRDVLIHMVYGKKIFHLKEENQVKEYCLSKINKELFIPKGIFHKATPIGGSCLLSFGIKKAINYNVPSLFTEKDFE